MEVTLYQPDGPCYKCKGTKRGLEKEGIPYTAVTADDETIERLKGEGHTTFPVVVATFGDNVTWTWSDLRLDYVKQLATIAS